MAKFPVWVTWTKVAVVIVIVAALSVVGCGTKINQVPTINSLIANPNTVVEGGSSTVTCTATDPDADTLTYTWSATGGTVTGTGSIITWIAPSAVGTYTITVTVADGNGGTASDDVVVTVISGNTPPVIASVVAADSVVPSLGTTTVTCTATDADGDTLTYSWSTDDGSISGSGASVTWQAPAGEDTYTVEVTVSDGQGGTDSGSTNIVVATVVTTGSIKVQSIPIGAKIYLDGVDTGSVTPPSGYYTIAGVSAGGHTIKLRYDYLKDMEGTVTVPAGGSVDISWDLTPNTAPMQSVTLQPNAAAGKDAYVYQGMPDENRGTNDQMCAAGGIGTLNRLFIEFDLSSISSTYVVTSAHLDLYYYNNAGGALEGPIGAYRITQSWDEGTITWNNLPNAAATAIDVKTIPASATNSFRSWYITTLVQDWVEGSVANYGVKLADTDESTAEKYKCFRSSDWGTAVERPKLTIQYYDPTP